MKLTPFLSALVFGANLSIAWADEALNFEDETTRINYSLGYQIGGDFKRQQVEMNAEAVIQGIRDALAGGEAQMSRPEMHETLRELKRKVVAQEQAQKKDRYEKIKAEGRAFLEQNAKQPGIISTDSGLQYKVMREGAGASLSHMDQVTVQYRGKKIDGSEFDSSFKRGKPASFQLNKVIKGWAEGLQLMKAGGKAELFIPYELAYGRRGPLAYQTLIFEVELLKVGEPEPEADDSTAE